MVKDEGRTEFFEGKRRKKYKAVYRKGGKLRASKS
jgi:hypothetical protein